MAFGGNWGPRQPRGLGQVAASLGKPQVSGRKQPLLRRDPVPGAAPRERAGRPWRRQRRVSRHVRRGGQPDWGASSRLAPLPWGGGGGGGGAGPSHSEGVYRPRRHFPKTPEQAGGSFRARVRAVQSRPRGHTQPWLRLRGPQERRRREQAWAEPLGINVLCSQHRNRDEFRRSDPCVSKARPWKRRLLGPLSRLVARSPGPRATMGPWGPLPSKREGWENNTVINFAADPRRGGVGSPCGDTGEHD